LVNYYKHANWAESDYHIIYLADVSEGKITVINRKKDILNNAKLGISIATHNSEGQIILYQY
jgi:hypothetical protein